MKDSGTDKKSSYGELLNKVTEAFFASGRDDERIRLVALADALFDDLMAIMDDDMSQ